MAVRSSEQPRGERQRLSPEQRAKGRLLHTWPKHITSERAEASATVPLGTLEAGQGRAKITPTHLPSFLLSLGLQCQYHWPPPPSSQPRSGVGGGEVPGYPPPQVKANRVTRWTDGRAQQVS